MVVKVAIDLWLLMSVVVLRLGRYFLATLLLNNWCSTSKGDRTYKFPSSPGFRIFYAGHIESITSWQKFMKSYWEPVLKDGLDTREKSLIYEEKIYMHNFLIIAFITFSRKEINVGNWRHSNELFKLEILSL